MKQKLLILVFMLILLSSCSRTNLDEDAVNSKNTEDAHKVQPQENTQQDKDEERNDKIPQDETKDNNKETDTDKLNELEILKLTEILSNPFEYKQHTEIENKFLANAKLVQPVLMKQLEKQDTDFDRILKVIVNIGDIHCLEILINKLSDEEDSSESMFYSNSSSIANYIRQMTGKSVYINSNDRFSSFKYTPEIKDGYKVWLAENKNYLFVYEKKNFYDGHRIQIDLEAKLLGIPTKEYRNKHPWIEYSEIQNWKDDEELNVKLKEFCYSVLLKSLAQPNVTNYEFNRNVVLDLMQVKDDRVVDILQRLTNFVNVDSVVASTLISAIRDRCDVDSVPYLEQFMDSKNHDKAMEAIDELQDKEEYGEPSFTQVHLKNPEYKELLIYRLENTIHEYYPYYIEIAGQLKDDRIVPILKKIMDKDNANFRHLYINHLYQYSRNNGEQLKIRTALALVKQGEEGYLDYLREKLKSDDNSIKLASAIALWEIKNKEGFEALIDIIKIRKLERGDENSSPGIARTIVAANVTLVRTACEILGEMGDKKAIPELKKLLELNLNGVAGDPSVHSGVAWSGRPEAVALAKLGDSSGEDYLLKRLMNGNFQEGTIKDLEKLNKRKYIKNLIQILGSFGGDKTTAAVAIINLLTIGE